ncbi:AraC family transcriptional regulator [Dysosmobacter sp.]|uniref:AraC family transcriptional regulator n=1 Tax=Dysosmobacter sp. TaxID=2591382 RepID=UPI002A8BBC82|nr:AraC family transcriptional regulator [Dysosmobacter sp.]MDY3281174.1 AraC family transcriptional regulator [Dysosmobacter sp.]
MSLVPCSAGADPHGRELSAHGTARFPVACYRDELYLEDVPCPWHWHDELEAVVVSRGEVQVTAGGETFSVSAGGGFFLNARVLHNVRGRGGGGFRLRSVVFHPRLVGGSADSVFWQDYLQPLLSPGAPAFVRLDPDIPWNREALAAVEAAWSSAEREPPDYVFRIRAALSELVFQLVTHLPVEPGLPPEKVLRNEERMKNMMRFIQAHYGEELTVARIAASISVSESECLRCFRAVIGTTPIQYLRQLRVQKAAELLAGSDRKISDIGEQCGFREMSYFTKTFRELMGCPPSRYREKKRAGG